MREILLVAVGGALGSLGRYAVGEWTRSRFGASFPWGTLTVNVLGSLLLGVLLGLALAGQTSRPLRLAVGTGFMGAFTTFSTFSCETYLLFERGEPLAAAGNALGNLAVGLAAATLGFAIARQLATP